MSWTVVAAVPTDASTWWLWCALSIVPDVLLVAGLVVLWRLLARNRREFTEAIASERLRILDAESLAERGLERRARTDELTRLLNRKELMDRLGSLLKHGERDLAVLLCDIDRFKTVNDTHGHAAGDAVLRAIGDRIRGCLRTHDDLGARIGGDELVVVLRGVHQLGEATQAAERLRHSAAEPILFEGSTIAVTLSIGVTLALPHEGLDPLLARADDAMYQAKELGQNRVAAIPPNSGRERIFRGTAFP
jgi:diguanylate cyclase (GGDEF)-like protein